MLVKPSWMTTLVIDWYAEGNVVESCDTQAGIVTFLSPLQPENAESEMLVTLEGIVTLVSPLQLENA